MEQNNLGAEQNQPPSAATTPAMTDELISVTEANNRIRHATANVAEKVRREMQQQYQGSPNTNNSSGLTLEEIDRRIAQRSEEQVAQISQNVQAALETEYRKREGMRIANNFYQKMESGYQKFPDFAEQVNSVPLDDYPKIVSLATEFENTDEIIYELCSHPEKLANINLVAEKMPVKAREMLNKISQTVKTNKQSKNAKTPNEPLSQLQPTPVGADNGSESVLDIRKQLLR